MARKTVSPSLTAFDKLPDLALIDVRLVALLYGCSVNTVWRRSRAGQLPKPLRLSENQTRWRVGEVRKSLESSGLDAERAA